MIPIQIITRSKKQIVELNNRNRELEESGSVEDPDKEDIKEDIKKEMKKKDKEIKALKQQVKYS